MVITTTVKKLARIYGQEKVESNACGSTLLRTRFGRSGIMTADRKTIVGIEQAGPYFYLMMADGCLEWIGADHPLRILD